LQEIIKLEQLVCRPKLSQSCTDLRHKSSSGISDQGEIFTAGQNSSHLWQRVLNWTSVCQIRLNDSHGKSNFIKEL